jgi:hypothetical protein
MWLDGAVADARHCQADSGALARAAIAAARRQRQNAGPLAARCSLRKRKHHKRRAHRADAAPGAARPRFRTSETL